MAPVARRAAPRLASAALPSRALTALSCRALSSARPPPPPPAPPPPSAGASAKASSSIVEIESNSEWEELVVKASAQAPPVGGPVILDLYADWCDPCKKLTPKLERLVVNAAGAVRLAKLNVDNFPEISQALQIKSLPTVLLLHKGAIADQFQGVLPDAKLKEFVEKAVGLAGGRGGGPRAIEQAAAALEAGDLPAATTAYSELMALPECAASARAGLALCALRDGNLALAQVCEPCCYSLLPGARGPVFDRASAMAPATSGRT